MSQTYFYPQKNRELFNHHFDSTIWNHFRFRDDDIVIASYGKAGTTWLQQIVAQMLLGPDPDLEVAQISPWLDLRFPSQDAKLSAVEAQTHRRFLKTHLPLDALVFSPEAKYLYIGRDGRDVVWSLYNHHANANQVWYQMINDTPGRVGPPLKPPVGNIRQYWHDWLMQDGYPFWSFWENVRTWWVARSLPNVLFLHYANMTHDMSAQMRRIAAFLDIAIDNRSWETIQTYCSFDWMKQNATKSVPLGGAFWDAGAQVFIHKGVNGRWAATLTPADVADYEDLVLQQLGPECAHWLATGCPID